MHKVTVSVRVHPAIKKELHKFADEKELKPSTVVRDAITSYLKRHEDTELHPKVKKTLDDYQEIKEAQMEDYFIDKQNQKISSKLRETTFIEFMDKNLGVVYMANKPHMDNERLKELLRKNLERMKNRAIDHGFEEEWEYRKEEPINYAEDFLDRKSLEEKAFNDYIDNM